MSSHIIAPMALCLVALINFSAFASLQPVLVNQQLSHRFAEDLTPREIVGSFSIGTVGAAHIYIHTSHELELISKKRADGVVALNADAATDFFLNEDLKHRCESVITRQGLCVLLSPDRINMNVNAHLNSLVSGTVD